MCHGIIYTLKIFSERRPATVGSSSTVWLYHLVSISNSFCFFSTVRHLGRRSKRSAGEEGKYSSIIRGSFARALHFWNRRMLGRNCLQKSVGRRWSCASFSIDCIFPHTTTNIYLFRIDTSVVRTAVINVCPAILTHPVNFPCGRKPEHSEKTHDFRQSVDGLFSYEWVLRNSNTQPQRRKALALKTVSQKPPQASQPHRFKCDKFTTCL